MTQPDNLVKLDMVFTLGDTSGVEDSAQFGVWGQLNFTPASSADWDTALGNLATFAVNQWGTDFPNTDFSNGCGLLHCRTARCDTTGHTVNEAIVTPTSPWTGDSGHPSLPWAVSLAVSLYGYTPGGFTANARNKRGRVYLPPLNTTIITDAKSGEPTIGAVTTIMDNFGGWLTDVAAHAIAESEQVWNPGILSTHRKGAVGYPGLFTPLTHLRVDNKLDTQRRRERQQPGVTASVVFPVV